MMEKRKVYFLQCRSHKGFQTTMVTPQLNSVMEMYMTEMKTRLESGCYIQDHASPQKHRYGKKVVREMVIETPNSKTSVWSILLEET